MPSEKPDQAGEKRHQPLKRKVEEALEKGFASVQSDQAAGNALDQLEEQTRGLIESDIAETSPPDKGERAAQAIKESAEESRPEEIAAAVLKETAREIAKESPPGEGATLDEAISNAGRESTSEPAKVRRGRRFLRKQLFLRLHPLQALDAIVFVQINNLPHPRGLDHAVSRFSWGMTGGHAWAIVILVEALRDPRYSRHAAMGVLPALWITTFTVEHLIKRFFRRRRPFISIIRAIVVGRKPGSSSFPSGHSAAAFAGSTLLAIYYPRGRKYFRLIAALVAFSRVYLGAHYPGDVISGSLTGAILARTYRRLFLALTKRK